MFHRVKQADVFVFCDTDRLSRKDFLTRNKIRTKNGDMWLTVPVLGGRDQRICDVEIDNTKRWQRKHWRTIEQAYGKAAWFKHYDLLFKPSYDEEKPWRWLCNWNNRILRRLLQAFFIDTPIIYASDHDFHGRSSDFILNMCKDLDATTYLCGSQGRNYLDLAAFKAAGIEVEIQDYRGEPLSAIHHLFTEGPQL